MEKIKAIESQIRITRQKAEALQAGNLEEPQADIRLARAAALEPLMLSILIDEGLISLIEHHNSRLSDIELIVKPIKDAQTTHKTIISWGKILTPLLGILAFCSTCYSVFLHMTHAPK